MQGYLAIVVQVEGVEESGRKLLCALQAKNSQVFLEEFSSDVLIVVGDFAESTSRKLYFFCSSSNSLRLNLMGAPVVRFTMLLTWLEPLRQPKHFIPLDNQLILSGFMVVAVRVVTKVQTSRSLA